MDDTKLTKAEIVGAVRRKTGLEKQRVTECYDEIISVIKGALGGRRKVELRGFGTFEVRRRAGRSRARNPRTGEPVSYGPRGVCVFSPGRELTEAVWNLDGGGASAPAHDPSGH